MNTYYTLEPHGPLVLRDNRSFGATNMVSAEWISPSVMAGTVRTVIGKSLGRFDHNALRAINVAGPFPENNGALGFVPPGDAVALKIEGTTGPSYTIFSQSPCDYPDGAGSDLPAGLKACFLDSMVGGKKVKGKPVALKGFWSIKRMTSWLMGETGQIAASSPEKLVDFAPPVFETRTHLEVNDSTQGAEEGKLFTCTHLALPGGNGTAYRLAIRVQENTALPHRLIHPVGGERRLACWTVPEQAPAGWSCPSEIATGLSTSKRLRMVLATPAIFSAGGWKPGWLDDNNQGTIPSTGVRVELKAACISRWKAVSGWSYEQGGPKAIRRMVPAGSVYFFEVLGGDAAELAGRWLQPTGDESPDGFGLALWGLWK